MTSLSSKYWTSQMLGIVLHGSYLSWTVWVTGRHIQAPVIARVRVGVWTRVCIRALGQAVSHRGTAADLSLVWSTRRLLASDQS